MRAIIELYEEQEKRGYSQVKGILIDAGNTREIVMRGSFEGVENGIFVEFADDSVVLGHDRHGRTVYDAGIFRVVEPRTSGELELFASGGLLPKIGKGRASAITVGKTTIQELLADVSTFRFPGLSDADRNEIERRLGDYISLVALDALLDAGKVTAHASQVKEMWGASAAERIRQNPFELGEQFITVSFAECIRLARNIHEKTGSLYEYSQAARCALVCCSRKDAATGNTYMEKPVLLSMVRDVIEKIRDIIRPSENQEDLRKSLEDAVSSGLLVVDGDDVFLRSIHDTSQFLAWKLHELQKKPVKAVEYQPSRRIRLCNEQAEAIRTILSNRISILLGGPGTGKTTVITEVSRVLEDAHTGTVGLAAPTGKAADRLNESFGENKAMTVHRMSGLGLKSDVNAPASSCRVIITDEASMLDERLARKLLEKVRDDVRLVFVGDFDQLTSIGSGFFLKDLADSGCFPVCMLRESHRQKKADGAASRLINDIGKGSVHGFELYDTDMDTDVFLVSPKKADDAAILDEVLNVVRALRTSYGPDKIKILTPYRAGKFGCVALNRILQPVMNKGTEKNSDTPFAVRDQVMQIVNDYDNEVFNGEIGSVVNDGTGGGNLCVLFGDSVRKRVEYTRDEYGHLEYAYALTVHKSQGSEYPAIVLPLIPGQEMMTRQLLYTACSRAQEMLVLVGSWDTIIAAVNNPESRRTRLAEMIRKEFGLDPTRSVYTPVRNDTQYNLRFRG